MSRKATNIVAYLTWIGLIVAFVVGDRYACRFHLNQALTLMVCGLVVGVVSNILAMIPILGWLLLVIPWLLSLGIGILTLVGLINAIQDVEKPLPLIGGIQILK